MQPARQSFSLRVTLGLCALSGAMLALCFPPAGLWPLAWVGVVPWLVAVRLGSGWGAVLGSWLGGFVFFGCLLYWLNLFGFSAWALACALLGLTLMLWGGFTRWTRGVGGGARVVGPAVLWAGIEWARGLGQFGFTWGWLGYSQSSLFAVLPVARAVGTIGISFLVLLVNAALAEAVVGALRREAAARYLARAAATFLLVALSVLAAKRLSARAAGLEGAPMKVAIIQGSAHGPLHAEQVNVPLTREEQRRTMQIYESLTAEAARERPALVVYPESVLPAAPQEDPSVAAWVARAARKSDAWLVAGGPYQDERGRLYNAAYLYAPSGNLVARYDKVQLVPFGEYVPGREWLPFLDRYNVRDVDFTAGAVHRLLQAGTVALGPMICFESVFPQISWQLVRRGAQVLVIITNDAWFGRTAAAAQHRQIAVLRAVETNRWLVRGASTGISCVISPDGRIAAEAGLYERKVVSAEIKLPSGKEREAAWGPVFSWLTLYLSIAYVIAPAAAPGRRRKAPTARPRARPRPRGRAAPR